MSRHPGRARAARAVAARRGQLGLTQPALAAKAGVDPKTIWSLESNESWPIARSRTRIEDALGWPAGEMMRIAESDEAPDAIEIRQPDGPDDALTELLAMAEQGDPRFDERAREIIAEMSGPRREAVEALYEQLLETRQANRRLLDRLFVLFRAGSDGDSDDGRGSGSAAL